MQKLKTKVKEEVRKHPRVWSLLHKVHRRGQAYNPLHVVHKVEAKSHTRAGDLLLEKGDVEGAVKRYRQAVSRKPELFVEISARLKGALGKEGGDSQDKLLSLIPQKADAFFKIGGALAKAERVEEAIYCYQRAVALNPQLLDANYWHLWNVYEKYVRLLAPGLNPNLDLGPDPDYAARGYIQSLLPEAVVKAFVESMEGAPEKPILQEDTPPGYASNAELKKHEEALNRSHTHFVIGDEQLRYLHELLNSLAEPIARCIGTPWRVVNTRCFKTHAGASETGPNEWHSDGFPQCILKFLIYLSDVGGDKGTTEMKLRDGSTVSVEGPSGTWLIFRSSELLHRGVAPTKGDRYALEITIVPALFNDQRPHAPGLNAIYPKLPWSGPAGALYDSLNLGGSPYFHHPGWLNLEQVASLLNVYPFEFHPRSEFPVASESIKTVYTSHALEHLDTPTVRRVVAETHRVLKRGGRFIIKIPDFDRAISCWKTGDDSYFTDEMWYLSEVKQTWKNRQIPDSIDYRAAFIFCGFWNDQYGDHFSRQVANAESAYHGPAVVEADFLKQLAQNCKPSEISAALREAVIEKEKSYHFNHQNAWGAEELKVLLEDAGFRIVSFDKEQVIANSLDVPDIISMKEQSLYCWAEKV